MSFVADATRFADRKRAFVYATTDPVARTVEHGRVHSRSVSLKRGARICDLGRCFSGRRCRGISLGVRRPGLRSPSTSDGLAWLIRGAPITECHEPCPEACLDNLSIGSRQRVLGG
jgi:hypothetical protein